MKNVLLLVIASLFMGKGAAQEITGDWYGKLVIGVGAELPLTFHITKDDSVYKGTRDSPKQKSYNIPVDNISLIEKDLQIDLRKDKIIYRGIVKNDTLITGLLSQNGRALPLVLTRKPPKLNVLIRPQEPSKPYPYQTEEVRFPNKEANLTLAGTFTIPRKRLNAKNKDKRLPAVILVSGSGANNRNEEIAGHKPFLILADHLTRNGIAVLRYDDRGTEESTGTYANSNTLDLSTDANAAITYLRSRKDIDISKIGILGHSEGGLIAPIVASQNPDVAFIGLLAGPGLRGKELLIEQGYHTDKSSGMSEEKAVVIKGMKSELFQTVIDNLTTPDKIIPKVDTFLSTFFDTNPTALPYGVTKEQYIKVVTDQVGNYWMQQYIGLDPSGYLQKVVCPVLAINGSLDLQVPSKINLTAIENHLKKGGNKDVTTIEIPNLNHLFQHTKTGNLSEYEKLDETFAPEALEIISNWIIEKTK